MKSLLSVSSKLFFSALFFLTAAPVFAGSVLEVSGSGTMETNCHVTLSSGCTINAEGIASGTNFIDAQFFLRIDTGSPVSANGTPVGTPQGVCIPGSFIGRIVAANGDRVEFSHAGLVCEEAQPGSAIHYNGTFRVTAGAGAFAAARGTGSLTAVFTRWAPEQAGSVLLYLRGVTE